MSQYVLVRVTRMDTVDIGLFEHDRNNTLYFYLMNADEQIYLRYGGRDSVAADTYLNLASLEIALAHGLELHEKYQRGELAKTARPKPAFPRDYPMLVERTTARGQCVECHLIGDFQNLHREKDKTLDKMTHLYRSPDVKTIGIHLDVPKGLVVKEARGAVALAGMQAGDRITSVNGTPVLTFGDLQHYYDKTDRRTAKTVPFTVDRAGKTETLTVTLPPRWWYYDVRYRQSSVDPRIYFDSRPLTDAEKKDRGLRGDGFACEVTRLDSFGVMMKSHELKVGDVIFAVDGVERDEYAHTAELYMKLKLTPGDKVKLDVLRDGKHIETALTSYRLSFRK